MQINNDINKHAQAIESFIANKIASHGPISFYDFMRHSLYEPGLGYYSAGSNKFGSTGDFVTAPEISELFGKTIAANICSMSFNDSASTNGIEILELGPGSGALALTIQDYFAEKNIPLKYNLLEVSAELKQQQQLTLQKYQTQTTWLDKLPENFTGIILANEVLDAMPVHRFTTANDHKILEHFVSYKKQKFELELIETKNKDLIAQLDNLNIKLPANYTSEINLALPSWTKALSSSLQQGVIIIIDYGYSCKEYYNEQRTDGTLKCFYRHTSSNNPLCNVGLQDISAHVNFSTLAINATQHGLDIAGFTTQAHFLMNAGILDIATAQYESEPLKTAAELKMLTMPSQMGETCKVMGFTKNLENETLAGFCNYNKAPSLWAHLGE